MRYKLNKTVGGFDARVYERLWDVLVGVVEENRAAILRSCKWDHFGHAIFVEGIDLTIVDGQPYDLSDQNDAHTELGSCEECVFWRQHFPEKNSEKGACQRFPPPTIGNQPETGRHMMCGEFKKREK